MAFAETADPSITEVLPAPLGVGVGIASTGDPSAWDVTFGGVGFNLKPSPQTPYQRGTEAVRKQQIDTTDAAGEQSLSNWWTRVQSSWDLGAGVRWFEPKADPETVDRFSSSQGVDVWTQGEFKLLRAVAADGAASASNAFVSGLTVGGVDGYVRAAGNAVAWVPETGTGSTATLPGAGATQPAAAGGVAWVGHDGGVSKFTPGSGVSTPYTCTGVARVWWAKARLVVALGPSLYELTPGGTGVVTTAGTLMYTHPDASWEWVDVCETGGAILAAGASQNDSGVFRFRLVQDNLNQPILSGGSQAFRLPPGEAIRCMGTYLGAYVVLGTSKGVRVGLVNDEGQMQSGPLTVEMPDATVDVSFRDRFAYVAVTGALPDGTTGALRVDLSAQVGDSGRFAWAWDVSTGVTGAALSLCLVGDRVVVTVGGQVYTQSATQFVASGWLDTGRVRFGTVEPKAFRLARMVAATNGGRVALTAVTPGDVEARVVEFTDAFTTTEDVAIQIPGGGLLHQYLSFRVTLTPSADLSTTPVVSGLSVKAVPAASRVRLFQFPLSVFDFEVDRFGEQRGARGDGFRRLQLLEALEESGAPTPVRDNRTGETFTGQVDAVEFTAVSPPDNSESGFGGVAVVVVRRL